MPIRIESFKWHASILEKVVAKHGVDPADVESALWNTEVPPYIEKVGDRYIALAQSETGGDYLLVVFAVRLGVATIITARRMTDAERRRFRQIRGT